MKNLSSTLESNAVNNRNRKQLSFRLLIGLFAFFSMAALQAQNINNYAFSKTTSGSLGLDRNSNTVDMSTGTVQLVAPSTDDAGSSVNSIGFDFFFQGAYYTQFSASSNGFVRLGGSAISGTAYTIGAAGLAYIAPFGGDLETSSSGKVHFKVVGSAPSRTLVIEFLNMGLDFVGSPYNNPNGTYQVRLYEGTGIVEFVYGAMATNTSTLNTGSFNIGISSSNTATTILSVNSAANTVQNTVFTNAYTAGAPIPELTSSADGSRVVYTFAPPVPNAPSNLTFTAVTAGSMTLNYTDNSSNELSFVIYRSVDGGATYTYDTIVAANVTSVVRGALSPSTTYYYRVYALTEGALSGPIANNATTLAPGVITSIASGLWSQTTTWSTGVVPTITDNVTITAGNTVTIDIAAFANDLNIQGTLQYEQTTARTLTTAADVVIGSSGTFQSNPAGTVTTHSLVVRGDLNNGGILDFSTNGNTAGATITFGNPGNVDWILQTGSTTDLRQTTGVTLNKGTSNTNTLTFTPAGGTLTVLGANTVGFLTITNGTFKIDGTSTFSSPLFNTASYTIAAGGGLWLNNPNATIVGLNGSPTNNGILRISQGLYNIGTSSGNSLGMGTGASFIMEGGKITVSGRINTANAVTFNQSGGIIFVSNVGNASSAAPSFGLTNANNSITISGGSINLIQASTGATQLDYNVQGSTINITGGTLNIGSGSTTTNFNFRVQGIMPNVVIDNFTNNKTATLSAAATVYLDATINTGATLNLNGFNLRARGNLINNGTLNGSTTGSRLTFEGSTAQSYSGTGVSTATLQTLEIQNSSTGVSIGTALPALRINMIDGDLINTGVVTLGNGTAAATIQYGTAASTVVAGNFDVAPVFNIGTGSLTIIYAQEAALRTSGLEIPVSRIVDSINVNNTNNVTIAGGDISTRGLAMLGGILNTSSSNLVTVTGTAVASVTGGSASSYVNGPLVRSLPASLATGTTYNFPIGKGSYNPLALVNPVTTTTGAIQAEVFDAATGGTAGTGLASIRTDRYWQIGLASGTAPTSFAVSLTDNAVIASSRVGYSATLAGTYNEVGGTAVAPVITSTTVPGFGFLVLGTTSASLSGTYPVGASAPVYQKLTQVAAALNSSNITGDVVFEMQADYDGTTGETFPITFQQFSTTGGSWKVTIRPASGASGLTTSGDPGTGNSLIVFNGLDNLTFDGRAGGTGSTITWTFRNTRTTATVGPVFQFQNDAIGDSLKYLNIQGQNSTTTSGLIVIGTTTGTSGNDNNYIGYNDIRDRTEAVGIPAVGLYAAGTTGATNSGNTIHNNRFQNLSSAGVSVTGTGNGDNWKIITNSFYNNLSTAPSTAQTAINFVPGATSTGDTISDNTIGGSNPGASGTPWTNSGAVAVRGIVVNVGTTGTSAYLNQNAIRNFSLTSTGASTFIGIEVTGGTVSVNNSTIGGPTTAESILVSGSSTTFGISSTSSSAITIDNNTIANLGALGTGTGIGLRGITHTSGGQPTITNNNINNLVSNATTTSNTTSAVLGIYSASTNANQLIANNTIYALGSSALTANTNVQGIVLNTAGSGGIVRGNKIYNLQSITTGAGGIQGIHIFNGGTWNIYNNQISITNSPYSGPVIVRGIWDNSGTSTTSNITFNTVYVGGTASGTANSFGFTRTVGSITNFKNNLIYNERSGGTGSHYAISNTNSTPATGWGAQASNYNYFIAAASNRVGEWGTSTGLTLPAWRTASVSDSASFSALTSVIASSTLFTDAANGDLKINPSYYTTATNIESKGTPITGVTVDFENDARPGPAGSVNGGATAPDIGADEFDGTRVTLDVGVTALLSPGIVGCHGATDTIRVRIRNFDTAPLNFASDTVTLNVFTTGTNPQVFPAIVFNSGSLAGNATLDTTITTTYNMSATGSYTFNANVTLAGDGNIGNDTLPPVTIIISGGTASAPSNATCGGSNATLTVSGYTNGGSVQWQSFDGSTWVNETSTGNTSATYVVSPLDTTAYRALICGLWTSTVDTVYAQEVLAPTVIGDTVCGTDTAFLSASGNGTLKWYDAATGGTQVTTGTTYAPIVSATDTFYVTNVSGVTTTSLGPLTNGIGAGIYTTTYNQMQFNVLSPVTVRGFYIYANATGTLIVNLTTSGGTVLERDTLIIGAGDLSVKKYFPLNWSLSPGTDYRITRPSGPATYRNSTGASYPYTIPGLISITGNTFDPAYYYLAYDWQIEVGCESPRVPVVALVNPAPGITLTAGDTILCVGESTNLTVTSANTGYAYSWTPATGLSATTGNTVTATPTTTTSYIVNAVDALAGCAIADTQLIVVNPLPQLVTAALDDTICEGDTTQLSVLGQSATISPSATQTFTSTTVVSIPDNNTTGVTASLAVNGVYPPVLSSASSIRVCMTLPHTFAGDLDITLISPSGTQVKLIDDNGGTGDSLTNTCFSASGASSVSAWVAADAPFTGTYQPQGNLSNFNGQDPNGTWTLRLIDDASGDTGRVTNWNLTFNVGGEPTYAWSPTGSLSSSTIRNPLAFTATTTTYTVTLTDTATGCQRFDTAVVTVNPKPVVNLGPDTVQCGGTVTLDAGNPGSTYLWSTGANTQTIVASATGTYSVTVTTANGCVDSDTIQVTIGTPFSFSFGNDTTVCNGITLATVLPGTYLWSTGAQTSSISITTSNTYSLTITNDGCTASDAIVVTVYETPVIDSITGASGPVCVGQPVQLGLAFQSPIDPSYTITWSPSSGLSATNISNPVATISSPVTYTVIVSSPLASCSDTATVTLNPQPSPVVNLGADVTQCGGSVALDAGNPGATYLWSTGATTQSINYSTQGTGLVSVLVSIGQCTDSDTVLVTINELPLPLVGQSSPDTLTICAGDTAQIIQFADSLAPAVSFSNTNDFSIPDNNIIGVASPIIVSGVPGTLGSGSSISAVCLNVNHTNVGDLNLILVGPNATSIELSDANGGSGDNYSNTCFRPTAATSITTGTAPFTGDYLPEISFSNFNGENPNGSWQLLAVDGTSGNVGLIADWTISFEQVDSIIYSWSPSSGLTASNIANPIASPVSTTDYVLTLTNARTGCSSTDTTTVVVNPLPTANLGPDVTQCGGTVTLDAGNPGATFLWSTGASTQTISVSTSNTYSVTVTTTAGCVVADTITVTILPVNPVSIGPDQTQCGGTVTLDAGTGYTTYAWSNGANTQSIVAATTNSYSVTVTEANGCTSADTANITIVATLAVNLGPDTTQCGGTVTLDAGNPGANYLWSTGATTRTITVGSGTYSVVADAGTGCSATDTITVTINTPPTVSLGPDVSQCGGTVILDAGAGFTAYNWSNGATTQSITVSTSNTYRVTVTAANGCTAADTAVVTINTPPTVSLGPDVTQCGGTVTLDAGNPGASYLWSTGATTQSIVASTSNSYQVTVTAVNGCTAADTAVVTINLVPTVSLGPDVTQCGGTVTLDAGAGFTAYSWSNGASTQTTTVSTSNTYRVTVTAANGCTAADTAVVTINSSATVNIGPDVVQCGGTVTLDAGNPGTTYLWSTGATTQSITATTSNIYSVLVTLPNGCTGRDTATIIINPVPTQALGPDVAQCGGTVTLNAGNPGATYLWSTAATSQTIVASLSGTYSVTVTNGNNCTVADTIVVTINPSAVVSLGADDTLCGPVVLDAGAGFTAYAWSNGASTRTVSLTTSGTYRVTVTNANGCTGSDTIVLGINATPVIDSIRGTSTLVCENTPRQLTAVTNVPRIQRVFTNGTDFTILSNATLNSPITVSGIAPVIIDSTTIVTVCLNATHTFDGDLDISLVSPAGTAINLSDDNGGGGDNYTNTCFSMTAATAVTAGVAPFTGTFRPEGNLYTLNGQAVNGTWNLRVADDAAGDQGVLDTWSITFSSQDTNYVWAWSPATGLSATNIANPIATIGDTTTYTVTYTNVVTGCADTATVTLNTTPLPVVSLGPDLNLCASSTLLDAGNPGATYAWSNGATTQTATISSTGTYRVTVTNASGCTATDTIVVTLTPAPIIDSVTSATNPICEGVPVQLTAFAANIPRIQQTYSNGTNFNIVDNSTLNSPITISGVAPQTIDSSTIVTVCLTATHTFTGDMDISLVSPAGTVINLSDDNGGGGDNYTNTCFSMTAATAVTAGVAPFTGTFRPEGNLYTLNGQAVNGTWNLRIADDAGGDVGVLDIWSITLRTLDTNYVFSWTPSAGLSATNVFNPVATVNDTTTYTVVISTPLAGCADTATITLNTVPAPVQALGPDVTQCGGTVTLNAGNAGATYLWSTGATVQSIPVTASGTYSVAVSNGVCTVRDTVNVTIDSLPVPSSLTATPDTVCAGSPSQLNAVVNSAQNFAFTNTTDFSIPDNAPNGVLSPITVSGLSSNLGSGISIASVCVNVAHAWIEDVDLTLIAPGGTLIDLSSDNGADGDNYTNTCFTPTATTNITAGAPPFTGNFLPEGSFSTFNGISANGAWNLRAADDEAIITGTLLDWTITFRRTDSITYAWSPATGLSATNIANPVASPTVTTDYIVTTTNTRTGCVGVDTVTVNVKQLPVVALGNDTTVCQSITLDAGNPGATYLWSTGATTQTISVSTTDVYSVTVTNNGCSGSDTINVTVNPSVSVSLGPDVTQCGGSVTLDAGNAGSTYLWSTGDATQIITVSSSNDYSVTVTTPQGCIGSDTVNVTINNQPVVDLGPDTLVCGSSLTLDAGNPGATYIWSNFSFTQTITVTTGGNYSVLVIDPSGCIDSDTIAVTFAAPISVSLPNIAQCGGTVTLDAGPGFASYQWSNGDTTQTTTISSTGFYYVTVTSAAGCTASNVSVITIYPVPTVNAGPDVTQCGGTVVLDAGAGFNTYQWSNGDVTQTSTVSNSDSYRVTVTDANGCTVADTVNVTINTIPTVALGPDVAQCGGTVTLDAGAGAASYLWSTTDVTQTLTVSSNGTYSVTVTSAAGCTAADTIDVTIFTAPVVDLGPDVTQCGGTVTLDAGAGFSLYEWSNTDVTQTSTVSTSNSYSVTVTDANGCTAADTVDITINPIPVVALGPDVVQCGGTVTLDAGAGYVLYEWSTGGNTQTEVIATSQTVDVTVTDANGCIGADTVDITINAIPVVDLGNDTSFCGSNYVLDAGNFGATYEWSNLDTTQTITVTTSGTYSVTVTAAGGCTAVDTVVVNLNGGLTVSLGADVTQCGGTVTLDAGAGFVDYQWSNGDSIQTTVISTVGTATYSVTVSDANGCTATDAIDVTINALPTVTLGPDLVQCGGSVTLDAGAGAASYLWSDNTSSQTLVVTTTNTYSVTVTGANGCTAADTINVTINPPFTVSLGNDVTQCGGTVTLNAGNPGSTYQWSTGDFTQQLIVSTSGTYYVVVTNPSGCIATDTVNVTINAVPVLPLGNDVVLCGGSVTLDAGNPGSTYEWSDGVTTVQTFTVNSTGTYSVTITLANGCSLSDTINVTINNNISVSLSLPFDTVCANASPITLSGGVPTGGTYLGPGVLNNVFDPMIVGAGSYNLGYLVLDTSGCLGTAYANVVVETCIGIDDPEMAVINVYPNPNDGRFTLDITNASMGEMNIEIVNVEGRKVFEANKEMVTGSYTKQFDLSHLAKGVYYVRLVTAEQTHIKRVVVQ